MNVGDEVLIKSWQAKGHICYIWQKGEYVVGVKMNGGGIIFFKRDEVTVTKSVHDIMAEKKRK